MNSLIYIYENEKRQDVETTKLVLFIIYVVLVSLTLHNNLLYGVGETRDANTE